MKRYQSLFIIVLTALSTAGKAQNWDEIFRQKKTQQKYLLQQIAGLKVYTDFAAKGYHIARTGLITISSLKSGELGLHEVFFKGLKTVNPKLKTLPQVAAIISCQLTILKGCSRSLASVSKQGVVNAAEMACLEKTYGKLKTDCAEILDQTFDVLSENQLEMNDARRIETINTLHARMQDNLAFFHSFSAEDLLLAQARKNEIRDIKNSGASYGLNPN
ncbi:MAG: hypothetical protein V4594_19940 [Bacteroidota bacterium]